MKFYSTFILALAFIFVLLTGLQAQIPAGYYNSTAGLTGMPLKTALYNIINGHTSVSYNNLYTYYPKTDSKAGNVVWDMYSDVPSGTPAYIYHHTSGDQCGSYSGEGDCYNREHSMPASWFNDATPMYSDLFLVVPTDGYVNNRRSNYPFGQVGTASWTSTNGTQLGYSDFPGYSGMVFEPIDEYKGDFARSFFYIATRYENIIAGWNINTGEAAHALAGNNTTTFLPWCLNLLYQWHIQDSVSPKEIARNDSVYKIQHNRNPYIDHPEWVGVVWNMPYATVQEEINEALITISPNPAQSYLEINFPATHHFSTLLVSDITGRILITQAIPAQQERLDVSSLEPGFYFLVLNNSGQRLCKPFVKN